MAFVTIEITSRFFIIKNIKTIHVVLLGTLLFIPCIMCLLFVNIKSPVFIVLIPFSQCKDSTHADLVT